MEGKLKRQSKLYRLSPLENIDEIEEHMERGYGLITKQTSNIQEHISHEVLLMLASQGHHDELCLGLFYGILMHRERRDRFYSDLLVVAKDGFKAVINVVNAILLDKFHRMDSSLQQALVWFLGKAIAQPNAEMCVHHVLRYLASGDFSPSNLQLISSFLIMMNENTDWLNNNPLTRAMMLFCFLRLVADHSGSNKPPQVQELAKAEVEFCVKSLRYHFDDCSSMIGRDLFRLMVAVAQIPPISEIWRDMLFNITKLSKKFTSVVQIMDLRTGRRFITTRITPELDRKLHFILFQVRAGQKKRYLDWLLKQHLATPESQSTRCDIARFVCSCIHPSNEVLGSDVLQRWDFLTWLIETSTSAVGSAYTKLALFYDWFFFNPQQESIMIIEPAMLLMTNNLRSNSRVVNGTVDFLCRVMYEFSTIDEIRQRISDGVHCSFRFLLDKRVVSSLATLFHSARLATDLRNLVALRFPELVKDGQTTVKVESLTVKSKPAGGLDSFDPEALISGGEDSGLDAEFSDEENEERNSAGTSAQKVAKSTRPAFTPPSPSKAGPTDLKTSVNEIEDSDFKTLIGELNLSLDEPQACDAVSRLVHRMLKRGDVDDHEANVLAKCLCMMLKPYFKRKILPDELSDLNIETSLNKPLFVVFRNLLSTPEDDSFTRAPLLMLIAEMYKIQPKIGYYLLYFLKASNSLSTSPQKDPKLTTYKDFCKETGLELEGCLVNDMTQCSNDDHRMFFYCITEVYLKFPNTAQPSVELMRLLCCTIDPVQLYDLTNDIILRKIWLFSKKKESKMPPVIMPLLNASLEWESMEQYFFWKLIFAEDLPIKWLLPIFPKLEYPTHVEAFSSLTIAFQRHVVVDLKTVRALLSRSPHNANDKFTLTCLRIMHEQDPEDLVERIATQFQSTLSHEKSERTKRSALKQPSLDYVIGHFAIAKAEGDHDENRFHDVFTSDQMKPLIKQAKQNFPVVYSKYSKFFDEILEIKSRSNKRRKAAYGSGPGQYNMDIPSSDEEETSTKRKRIQEESDSD